VPPDRQLPSSPSPYRRATPIKERVYGPDHEVALTLVKLSVVQHDLGELPAARRVLDRAVAILHATLGIEDPSARRAQGILDELPDDAAL
jgi:hypothetical protein